MIELLKETELEYVRCFSREVVEEHVRRFRDENFKDSYANNISILKEELEDEELIKVINFEIENSLKRGEYFLHFELHGGIEKNIVKKFKMKPNRIDTLVYMAIDVKKYSNIKSINSIVNEVTRAKEFKDIININVEDYAPIVGKSYATRRINRKIKAYKDEENNLKPIICYDGNIPVGSCEVLLSKNVVKIEDFGILNRYQNKGFGSSILKYVMKKADKENKDILYVITEQDSLAKSIYEKLGFKEVARKTQIIFDF